MKLQSIVFYAVIGLLSTPLLAATFYKCTDKNGKVVFSDIECDGNAKKEELKVAKAPKATESTNRYAALPNSKSKSQCEPEPQPGWDDATEDNINHNFRVRSKRCRINYHNDSSRRTACINKHEKSKEKSLKVLAHTRASRCK
ncbi:DUF4124 domain-containing protein [Pseudoalteromonas sp. MMG024]|uniref:DUF4124 domain-containing protein n=1 Tax=Pseudoalteromonas sp. MMG024 TaxID=2909980 RepID=UPI001F231BE3|nr:DUF4124 domain-containing protein [Pseudoalteromonas sp. MMG024]MCF6459416.1 DUF4124 domain-containing protein [Pseudoalteromonas sp. MMG024]